MDRVFSPDRRLAKAKQRREIAQLGLLHARDPKEKAEWRQALHDVTCLIEHLEGVHARRPS